MPAPPPPGWPRPDAPADPSDPAAPALVPAIVVRDVLAVAGEDGLVPADARTVELTLAELARLTEILGAEGLLALSAYLAALRREELPDGRRALLLADFSARWLTENTSLTRNGALRAQRALEAAGLFSRIVAAPGVGARGKQRAVLNGDLVLIAGGRSDRLEDLRRQPGGPRRASVSRQVGDRETGGDVPVSRKAGNRESGPDPRSTGIRETGTAAGENVQVSAGLPDLEPTLSTGPTSSQSSRDEVHLLVSTPQWGRGQVLAALRPALVHDWEHAAQLVHEALNDTRFAPVLGQLGPQLRCDGPPTQLLGQLVEHLGEVLLEPDLVWHDLDVLGCFRPRMEAELVAERFVVAVVAGLGVSRVDSWGGWLGKAMRPGWAPRPNEALVRFANALRRLAATEARRRERLVEAGAAGAAGPTAPARSGATGLTEVGLTEVAGPVAVADGRVAGGLVAGAVGEGAAARPGSVLPDELPEELVAAVLPLAQADPDLATVAAAFDLSNPVRRQRLVKLYLSGRGQAALGGELVIDLPGVAGGIQTGAGHAEAG